MKTLQKYLKPLSFIPAIFLLCIIFSFSAQNGQQSGDLSYRISYKIVETKSHLLEENKTENELADDAESIHLYVRKAGHMGEYFLLSLSFLFPFFIYGMRGKKLVITALILCIICASLDEYHQSFVDGRGPSVIDVGIDTIGASIGLMLAWFCRVFQKKRRSRK